MNMTIKHIHVTTTAMQQQQAQSFNLHAQLRHRWKARQMSVDDCGLLLSLLSSVVVFFGGTTISLIGIPEEESCGDGNAV